jgi:primosomal protein N' (replication factor Y)
MLLGPVPAPMERRAGRYRAQLLVQASKRAELQRFLSAWVPLLYGLEGHAKVRWSIDVDPQEMF